MPSPGVAAVDRALTILAAFEDAPEPMTLAELAKRTKMYKSTLLRLMASLQEFGYLVQLADGRYHLGPTPFRLGAVYQRNNNLHDRVMPLLRQLVADGTESPSYHVRHDAKRRLCVFRVDSQHSTLDRVEAGMLLPLERGAAGRVILAFDGEKGATYDAIRGGCIAVSFGERDPDCAGLACPVFGSGGKCVGALSLSGPKPRFTRDNIKTMASLLLKAAIRLTRTLGGPTEILDNALSALAEDARPARRARR
ncbi:MULTISPECIES: IclR family transcriptional regulator [unclassified Bradyrhizobium]|uniref:IclR family transcriptional regulator n=1 Tax=unclassified Bradyrhizobium TaxID=2631580 RepID=UPI001CD59AEA|nr:MULTISPECIES: IclR family transcriptional regulator [unclassified Bradyrhizobium]MCA1376498.1 IclR family transcriptional regulator [Bradyrhizobium sp. IC4060]MCA1484263.1 IclR family transcriptional regulator [Bradyrhizobium sp. IC4061]MCA1539863.1 IclR family transcriptional regulator [Bradyrhizobium sp. NBAIM32]